MMLLPYEYACERLRLLREQWEAAGKPFTAKGTRGTEVEHPLTRFSGSRRSWWIVLLLVLVPVGWVVHRRRLLGYLLRSMHARWFGG